MSLSMAMVSYSPASTTAHPAGRCRDGESRSARVDGRPASGTGGSAGWAHPDLRQPQGTASLRSRNVRAQDAGSGGPGADAAILQQRRRRTGRHHLLQRFDDALHHPRMAQDIVENVPTGRLYRLSAAGHLEKLMDGILFANGVALAPDGSHVVLAETGKCRLHRYWLKGPETGKSDILCVLPGYPDNISAGSDGLVWVSIPTERNNALNVIHKMPLLLRRLVARLPKPLQPKPAAVAGSWRSMPRDRPFMTSGGRRQIFHGDKRLPAQRQSVLRKPGGIIPSPICTRGTFGSAQLYLNRVQFGNRSSTPVIEKNGKADTFSDPRRVEPWFSNWTRFRLAPNATRRCGRPASPLASLPTLPA